MTALYILAAAAAGLLLLALLPMGCRVEYGVQGLRAWARLGPLRIQLLPWKLGKGKRAEAGKKKPEGAQSPPQPEETPDREPSAGERLGGALNYAQALLPVAVEAAGQFYRRLRMDLLDLELTVGCADPADAAVTYGRANVLLAALWEPLTEAFHVKDGRARVKVDFQGGGTRLYGQAALSIRVGQAVYLGLRYGLRGFNAFLKVRDKTTAAKQHRKAA